MRDTPQAQTERRHRIVRIVAVREPAATRRCNLRIPYCHDCHDWREGPGQDMPFAVLAPTTTKALTATPALRRWSRASIRWSRSRGANPTICFACDEASKN
jgi:hypothetical protein